MSRLSKLLAAARADRPAVTPAQVKPAKPAAHAAKPAKPAKPATPAKAAKPKGRARAGAKAAKDGGKMTVVGGRVLGF